MKKLLSLLLIFSLEISLLACCEEVKTHTSETAAKDTSTDLIHSDDHITTLAAFLSIRQQPRNFTGDNYRDSISRLISKLVSEDRYFPVEIRASSKFTRAIFPKAKPGGTLCIFSSPEATQEELQAKRSAAFIDIIKTEPVATYTTQTQRVDNEDNHHLEVIVDHHSGARNKVSLLFPYEQSGSIHITTTPQTRPAFTYDIINNSEIITTSFRPMITPYPDHAILSATTSLTGNSAENIIKIWAVPLKKPIDFH